ncbi:hypothetical protein HOA59_00225 [archaeon]|jgi:uncharacterized coiled-coil DUF342 family protein|nr:hypothetical protein [archaeon]MBT6823847.1 hypothetical protein [archaeon]MBT7107118.1 hypothetical protein [archaeon]MBT7297228.1 hypothetical protein [archaeon]
MVEKKDDKKKSKDIKSDISSIRKDLNRLNVEKEKWFAKKEKQKKELGELIKKIKGLKVSKDQTALEIKTLKEQRDKYNDEVQGLIESYKKLSEKKKEFLDKTNIDQDPSIIVSQIEKIESKIETEALPFKKEQSLMKQLKKLRSVLLKTAGIREVIDAIKKISEEITQAKDTAQGFHEKLKKAFIKNKDGYSEFMKLTKKITDLKKEQEESFSKFIDAKKEFAKVNDLLKERLMDSNKYRKKSDMVRGEKKRKEKERIKEELDRRTKQVEEKLKTKKKLTTEDLLVFQNQDDNNR